MAVGFDRVTRVKALIHQLGGRTFRSLTRGEEKGAASEGVFVSALYSVTIVFVHVYACYTCKIHRVLFAERFTIVVLPYALVYISTVCVLIFSPHAS